MKKQYHGFLLVDKPVGLISRRALNKALRVYGKKGGIEGILDPFASGLLILGFGMGTRFFSVFHELPKTYSGTILFGSETDTLDPQGKEILHSDLPSGDVELWVKATEKFQGSVQQIPPAYSNVKVGGVRSRELAFQGTPIEPPARSVFFHHFEITNKQSDRADFIATVSAGTYLRSLARDFARELHSAGHLIALRRLSIGNWTTEQAFPLNPDIDFSGSVSYFLPIDKMLSYPEILLSPEEALALRQGRVLPTLETASVAKLYTQDATEKKFLGLGMAENNILKSVRLLPEYAEDE